MNDMPKLIVMLTYRDVTVKNAYEIFQQNKSSKAQWWGFKDTGLPFEEMRQLFSYMKQCGKKTVLESVHYTEAECLRDAQTANICGCDMLIGTVFSDSVHRYCVENQIAYMPYIGDISGRPSLLNGSIEDMKKQAKEYADKGVSGVNLAAYRYTGNPGMLLSAVVPDLPLPVCIAGSIDSPEKIAMIGKVKPDYFTIGSAFFDKRFGETFAEQIDKVSAEILKSDIRRNIT